MELRNSFIFKSLTYIFLASVFLLGGCASTKKFVNSGCEKMTEYPEYRSDPASRISKKTVDLRELPCFWFSTKKTDTQYDATMTSLEFANASFVYAIAANDAYEKPSSISEDIPFPSSETWLPEIMSREIPRTGFFAKSWVRKTNSGERELVISYRGTSGDIEDWTRGNLFITNLFFIDNQFDNAVDFAEDSIKKAKDQGFDSIVFTGHSLGGGLAQYAQRYFKDSRAVAFDASPNRGRIYSIFDWNLYPINSLRIYENGEVLDYIRKPLDFDVGYDETPYGEGKKTRWMSFYSGGPVAQHDMQDLAISLVKVAASSGNIDALDIIKQLETRRTKEELSQPYYELRNTYNENRRKLRQSSISH